MDYTKYHTDRMLDVWGKRVISVCDQGRGVILVKLSDYFDFDNEAARDQFELELDAYGNLRCPVCNTNYGKEWPGV